MSAPITQVASPTTVAVDVDALTNGYYRVFVANASGVLSDVATNKVTISVTRACTSDCVAATTTTTVALTCAAGGTCVVGDTGPGGGIVFYVAAANFTSTGSDCGTTCKYLEAAPADIAGTYAWCSDTSTSLGVTATAVGTGMANTTTASTTCTSGAVQKSVDYSNNGKTDWHLPSKDELNEMCKYAKDTGQAAGGLVLCTGGSAATSRGFSTDYYWSSSEATAYYAWVQTFNSGGQGGGYKNDSNYRVRPVRAFG